MLGWPQWGWRDVPRLEMNFVGWNRSITDSSGEGGEEKSRRASGIWLEQLGRQCLGWERICGREIRKSGWLSPRNLRLDITRPGGAGR